MILSVAELVAQAKKSVQCVSAAQAFARKDATFIDVREASEVATSPVANSLAIPRGVLEMNIAKHCADANMEIYLHCASGGRAALAAEQLQRIGYSNVKAISCAHNQVCQAQQTL
ncbi:Rhodanese-related sulfurtransferase [Colwellia chukchiensis]|uniref:Rhodanese-related sulfurtransferase n=1 Tax=Colwellia chukchiensis TaxID=641665 RepID=A0A1H7TJQ9_9GAMM|nr:rhodanese-like domain-containing protein [Colwellia chukchiensis]SEL84077.1 Rhodanese-related sulfurtransferase [Colwellia chukchiensis]